MKKLIPIYSLILIINSVTTGQTVLSFKNDLPVAVTSGEAMSILTDRSLYCSGEHIYFTGEYSCIKDLDSFRWSNVVYIELITWNGAKLAQMKMKLDKPGISGCIRIPDDLRSGNYYLRAYTKWMRNFSVYNYAYVPVKVVNPFVSEIDQGPESSFVITENDSFKKSRVYPINSIICSTNKKIYTPGEKAAALIDFGDHTEYDSDRYCITIARAGTIDTTGHFHDAGSTDFPERDYEKKYLPEINGITISGKVINQITGLPVNHIPVSLSEPQTGSVFCVYYTNKNGEFVFSMPDMTGKRDFFLQAETPDSLPLKIMIADEYCVNRVRLPYIQFTINKDEDSVVRDMVINKQLSDKFSSGEKPLADQLPEIADSIPFYGSKRTIYLTEKYIELPNIEEFIYEIVFETNVKNSGGVTKVVNKGKTAFSNYPPLILMDNIHITNHGQLLKVPLNKIERVEAIDKGYVVGTMKYNGILSIYSKNSDFAGIDLTQNSRFITYDLFTKPHGEYAPNKGAFESRMPDRRNLVYWNPDIQINTGDKKAISFDIPDTKGRYMILIRSKNSPDVSGSCYFTVN